MATRNLIVVLLVFAGSARAQNRTFDDPPKLLVLKTAPTRLELEQRDALKKFVVAVALIHEEKFTEALKLLEESARLDPDAPAVFRLQVPILVDLGRNADAISACRKTVDLDPGDYATWYALAKLNKALAKYPDTITAMEAGLKSARLKERPEIAQQILVELGGLYESIGRPGPAADAMLEHPETIQARSQISREAILGRAADMHENAAQLYRKAKQYELSLAAYRKAQTIATDRAARLAWQMAQTAEEHRDLPAALAFLDEYLRTRPLSVDPYELRASLLRRMKRPEQIVPWIEQVATGERHNDAIQALLAREYALAKQHAKAEAVYLKLLEESPHPDYYRGLFALYKDADRPARILEMFNKAIDKPVRARAMIAAIRDDGDIARKLVDVAFRRAKTDDALKFETVYFLAIVADKHRKADEAEQFYRQCLRQADPSNEAILYGNLLRVLNRARKYQAAVDLCRQGLAAAKATNLLVFYDHSARALAGLHRYDEALTQADEAAKRAGDGSRLGYQLLRLRILSMADRFDAAERECLALLKTTQRPADIVEVRYVLSGIYSAAKQSEKAEEQLQLLLKIDPDNATVNNDLGYQWADQGRNLEAAEAMIRKALDLDRQQRRTNPNVSTEDDKDNAAYVDSLGWVLFRRGKLQEARAELERAAVLDGGEDPVIFDHLGDVYYRLEMPREAAQSWQRSLDLYDQGQRRKDDTRLNDLRRKLKLAKE